MHALAAAGISQGGKVDDRDAAALRQGGKLRKATQERTADALLRIPSTLGADGISNTVRPRSLPSVR